MDILVSNIIYIHTYNNNKKILRDKSHSLIYYKLYYN